MKTDRPDAFGPYRVLRELGRGGMGRVFEVQDPSGRRAALKTLDRLRAADVALRERFRREAEALARLDHPHVVRVHAAEVAGPEPYLVQELLPGGSLAERLADGPLPLEEARALLRKLAVALVHCHAQGVLHRDLKPANVMFDERGEPRLVDFGLSRIGAQSTLTTTGEVLGTPQYMSPEQARGDVSRVGEQADVYGLGALLFATLTGQAPFAANGGFARTLEAVLHEPAPDLVTRPEISPELAGLCARALAKDPRARPAGPAAFAEALGAGGPPQGTGLAIALGLVAIALTAGLGAALASASAPAAPAPVASPNPPLAEEGVPLDWDRVRVALEADDPVRALALLGLAPGPGVDEARWLRAYGAALLLQGQVEQARAACQDLAKACLLELERVALEESLRAGPGEGGWTPRALLRYEQSLATRAWIEQGAALLERFERVAEALPPEVGALRGRVAATLDRLLCSIQGGEHRMAASGAAQPLLLRAQRALGREPLLRAEAVLVWVRTRDARDRAEARALLEVLASRPELRLWWAACACAWGYGPEGAFEALALDLSTREPWPWLASELLEAGHGDAAEQLADQAAAALEAGDGDRARERLALARAHAQRSWDLARQRAGLAVSYTSERDQPLLICGLLAGDTAFVRGLLAGDKGADGPRHLAWDRLFRAELALLEGALDQAEADLEGLALASPGGAEDLADPHYARAALALARGDRARAQACFDEAPQSLPTRLPWRSRALTRRLLAGEDLRVLLRD